MFAFIVVAVVLLVRSNVKYSKKEKVEAQDDVFKRMMSSKDKSETLALLRQHVKETLADYVDFAEKTYVQVTEGLSMKICVP